MEDLAVADRSLHTTNFTNGDLTRAQQYTLIDRRIAESDKFRIRLSTARNDLTDAARMTSEILNIVFQRHMDNMLAEGEDGELHPTWYFFSHVCSRWRIVAIGNPALWSRISFRYLGWMNNNLIRSAAYPLIVNINRYIEIPTYPCVLLSAIQRTLAEISRIRCLDVKRVDTDSMKRFLQTVALAPAPILESLSLLAMEQDTASPFVVIPKKLFGGMTPNLRYVHIRSCKVDFDSSILVNLVRLHLDCSSISHISECNISISELLTILALSPSLEILHLDTLSPTHSDVAIPNPFTFSHLEHIHLLDKASFIARMFDNIRLPSFTSVSIDCTDDVEGDFSCVAKALTIATGDHPPKQILNLLVERSEILSGKQLCIAGRMEKQDDARVSWNLIFIWNGSMMTQVEVLLSNVIHGLDVSALLRIRLREVADIAEDTWREQFAPARHLEDLVISKQPIWGVLNALSSTATSPMIDIALFPKLQHLAIADVPFDNAIKELMLKIVCKRLDKGYPIKYLDIRLCRHFRADWEQEFREYIPVVFWDGYRRDMSPDHNKESDQILDTGGIYNIDDTEGDTSSAYGSEYASIDEYDYQE